MRRSFSAPVLAGAVLAVVALGAFQADRDAQAQAEQSRLVVFEKFSRSA